MYKLVNKLSTTGQLRSFRNLSTTSARMQIENVMIIGSGLMGSGIAQSVAQSKHNFNSIVVQDVEQKSLDKAKANILSSLQRMKKKNPEIDEQKIISKIQFTNQIKPASEQNLLIIEAVPEIIDLKQKLFKDLSSNFGKSDSVILATNTSSLSCKDIGIHVQKKKFRWSSFFQSGTYDAISRSC